MTLEIYSLVTFPRLAVEIPILLVIYVHTVKPIRPGKTPLFCKKHTHVTGTEFFCSLRQKIMKKNTGVIHPL